VAPAPSQPVVPTGPTEPVTPATTPSDPTTASTGGVSTTPDPGTEPSAADDAAELWGTQYDGTAQLSVDVYDYCSADGSRHLAETKRYSMTGTLELGRPRDGGGETENNPFTLVLSVGQPSEAGAVSFWSSAVSTASGQDLAGNPRDPRVMLTYWDL
jgi:hypothetical protein